MSEKQQEERKPDFNAVEIFKKLSNYTPGMYTFFLLIF